MDVREQMSVGRRLRLTTLTGVSVLAMGCAAAAHDREEKRLRFPLIGKISIVPISVNAITPSHDVDAKPLTVSISPGPLEPALAALARQMQIKLAYQTRLTENLVTRGVNGEFLPLEALAQLLDGTGLTYQAAGPSTITLVNPRYTQLGGGSVNAVTLDELAVEGDPKALTGLARLIHRAVVCGVFWADGARDRASVLTRVDLDRSVSTGGTGAGLWGHHGPLV